MRSERGRGKGGGGAKICYFVSGGEEEEITMAISFEHVNSRERNGVAAVVVVVKAHRLI